MSTSSDSDITSDEESGVRGQTGKRGDINASRKKYLRRGGKHGNNNDDGESHPPCKKRRVTTSKGKIKTSEEEEGNKLSAFLGAPIDSPMENKTSSSEGEEEDECVYTHYFKEDGCPNLGRNLVECPHNNILHGNCQRGWEKWKKASRPGVNLPTIKRQLWLCPSCHPWYSDSKDEEDEEDEEEGKDKEYKKEMEKNASTITDSANGQQSAIHSFLQQFAKPKGEEAANHGPDDRFDAICVAFTKQMVHDIDGTLNATHKLIRVKKAMKRDLETILTGNELNRAKQQSCYARLKILLEKYKTTISGIFVLAMQLGKLIHKENAKKISVLTADLIPRKQ